MKEFDFFFRKLGIKLKDKVLCSDSSTIENELFKVSFTNDLSINLRNFKSVYVEEVFFDLEFQSCPNITMFRNGFQSWSPSYEINFRTRFKKCLFPVLQNHYLDPEKFDERRSHFFTYLRCNETYLFLSPENNSLKVSFELKGKNTVRIFFEIGKIMSGNFTTPKIKTKESSKLIAGKKVNKKTIGWTSWYYYYRHIDPKELLLNAEYIQRLPFRVDYFQIDDGWQKSTGEWEENEAFKGKLKDIAEKIREKDVCPGIWLAPFVVERKSEIYDKNRDWLIKDRAGNPRPVGFNPTWSGYFYSMDPTNISVADYLTEKIMLLKKMGFGMFKFDFLYSLMTKTGNAEATMNRMEVFKKGMSLLREAIGDDSILLGCGAPVIPDEWLYDFLRIGPDTKDGWEDSLTRLIGFQGRVSAKNSLRNTITRAFINGAYFVNDPDVVFFNPKRLTNKEKETILITDYFLSDFIFFSDPLYKINLKNFELLMEIEKYNGFLLDNVKEVRKDIFRFKGNSGNNEITGIVNLTEDDYFIEEAPGEIIFGGNDKFIPKHSIGVFKK